MCQICSQSDEWLQKWRGGVRLTPPPSLLLCLCVTFLGLYLLRLKISNSRQLVIWEGVMLFYNEGYINQYIGPWYCRSRSNFCKRGKGRGWKRNLQFWKKWPGKGIVTTTTTTTTYLFVLNTLHVFIVKIFRVLKLGRVQGI